MKDLKESVTKMKAVARDIDVDVFANGKKPLVKDYDCRTNRTLVFYPPSAVLI